MSGALEFVPGTIFSRGEDQISGELDGSVMLMSVSNGEYYSLNGAGNRIWEIIGKPATLESIIACLVEEYEVDAQVAERETRIFLGELAAKGLVRVLAG